jgi:hypothetical protein
MSDSNLVTTVWHRSGYQDQSWVKANVNLQWSYPGRLRFVAEAGGPETDISLDDVDLASGPCQDHGLCTFEDGFCTWSHASDQEREITYFWKRGSGSDNDTSHKPSSDHTLETEFGHFAYVDPRQAASSEDVIAIMESEEMLEGNRCLRVWIYTDDFTGSVTILQHYEGFEVIAGEISSVGDGEWLLATTNLNGDLFLDGYKVRIVGSAPSSAKTVAIDDLEILLDECPRWGNCDFERDMCIWNNQQEEGVQVVFSSMSARILLNL